MQTEHLQNILQVGGVSGTLGGVSGTVGGVSGTEVKGYLFSMQNDIM